MKANQLATTCQGVAVTITAKYGMRADSRNIAELLGIPTPRPHKARSAPAIRASGGAGYWKPTRANRQPSIRNSPLP